MPTSQAMEMAREANLDLVEVAANERPPVCKILDYGKFRYQQSRKSTKSKVHQQKLKEMHSFYTEVTDLEYAWYLRSV